MFGTPSLKEFFCLKEFVDWSQCSPDRTTGPTVYPLKLSSFVEPIYHINIMQL